MKGTYFGTAATPRGTASHILGRPGPGEPSGFPVAPGLAEGVAEGEAEGAGLSLSPAPSASRAQPSRHLRLRKPSSPPGPAQTPTSSP